MIVELIIVFAAVAAVLAIMVAAFWYEHNKEEMVKSITWNTQEFFKKQVGMGGQTSYWFFVFMIIPVILFFIWIYPLLLFRTIFKIEDPGLPIYLVVFSIGCIIDVLGFREMNHHETKSYSGTENYDVAVKTGLGAPKSCLINRIQSRDRCDIRGKFLAKIIANVNSDIELKRTEIEGLKKASRKEKDPEQKKARRGEVKKLKDLIKEKQASLKKVTQWRKDGGMIGYICSKDKGKTIFGLSTGKTEFEDLYEASRESISTPWGSVPAMIGHLDLIDEGTYKVKAPDEIAKKLKVDSMDLNIFSVRELEAEEAAPLVALAYDHSFAADYQRRAFQAEDNSRYKEKIIKRLETEKWSMAGLEHLKDILKGGDAPTESKFKSFREMIGPWVKWIMLAGFIVAAILLVVYIGSNVFHWW